MTDDDTLSYTDTYHNKLVCKVMSKGKCYTMIVQRNALDELYRISTPDTPTKVQEIFDKVWTGGVGEIV